jgi:hypothetical protein
MITIKFKKTKSSLQINFSLLSLNDKNIILICIYVLKRNKLGNQRNYNLQYPRVLILIFFYSSRLLI